jgi:trk/ktr system potassium uptake protein
MRIARVLGVIGRLLRIFCLGFLPPMMLAFWDGHSGVAGQYQMAGYFAIAMAITFVCGHWFAQGFVKNPNFRRAEALGVVAGSWLIISHFAAIPYLFDGLNYFDAFFESMSGFTTTGATILQDFSAHGRAFFLWRSMTQWFGGLGVIAIFVVILPQLGIAGRQMLFAESSTAPNEVVSSRVRESARRLWVLYVALTIGLVAMLMMVAGFPLYDAACHALTTMSAGGFSPHPSSIAGYQNPMAEWILVGFMILAGTSFPLLWVAVSRNPLELLRDGEFRFYLLVTLIAGFALALILAGGIPDEESLRLGAFQSASLISSTGYASTDFNLWSDSAKVLLIMVMLVGGCAGSAAGGPKAIRNLFGIKFVWREITRSLHPRAVLPLRHKGKAVPDPILRAVLSLIGLYLMGYFFFGTIMVLMGADLVTGFTAALACLGNIGPGFDSVGPMGSFADFHPFAKLVLTMAMWFGRLEIVTVLALMHPDVWRRLRWSEETRDTH